MPTGQSAAVIVKRPMIVGIGGDGWEHVTVPRVAVNRRTRVASIARNGRLTSSRATWDHKRGPVGLLSKVVEFRVLPEEPNYF